MPYTMEDFKKDAKREFVSRLTPEDLATYFTPEQRIDGLTPAQRNIGLTPEQRIEGLTPEQRTQLYQMLSPKDDNYCLARGTEKSLWRSPAPSIAKTPT